MNTYKMNYLNGNLTIVCIPENNITIGKLDIYDEFEDNFLSFKAIAKNNEDIYDEKIGKQIVKLKLSKKFYHYKRKKLKNNIDVLLKYLNNCKNDLVFIDKKINNIQNSLSKFGLKFYK